MVELTFSIRGWITFKQIVKTITTEEQKDTVINNFLERGYTLEEVKMDSLETEEEETN